jgi:hypothetical protein
VGQGNHPLPDRRRQLLCWLWIVGTVDMSFFAAGDTVCFLALLGRLDDFS